MFTTKNIDPKGTKKLKIKTLFLVMGFLFCVNLFSQSVEETTTFYVSPNTLLSNEQQISIFHKTELKEKNAKVYVTEGTVFQSEENLEVEIIRGKKIKPVTHKNKALVAKIKKTKPQQTKTYFNPFFPLSGSTDIVFNKGCAVGVFSNESAPRRDLLIRESLATQGFRQQEDKSPWGYSKNNKGHLLVIEYFNRPHPSWSKKNLSGYLL